MPDPKTRNRLRGLRLSAGEIQRLTGWPNDMVLDYLSNRQNAVILSTLIDIEIDQTIEEVPTEFLDGSIPYADSGFLVEDNTNFMWDAILDILIVSDVDVTNDLNVGGDVDVGADLYIEGEITSVEAIQLDLAAGVSVVEGQQGWNVEDGTIDVGLPGGVVGQMFEETYFGGKNATGSDVADGTPVMFAAPVGVSGKIEFQLAIADGTIPSEFTMGLTTQDIAAGDFGKVTWFGKVRGIDTTGTPYGEVWADGDLIYVSATTAGDLTNVKPNVPNRIILVAAVVVSHSNGTLQVRPTWKSKLVDLDDVNGTALTAEGQFLVWDQANGFFDFNYNINDYVPKIDITYGELYEEGDSIITADTATLNTGTLTSGTVVDTRTINNVYYQVTEVTGTPGFDVEFNYTLPANPGKLVFKGRYQGSIGHSVVVEAWNYTALTWDSFTGAGTDLPNSTTDYDLSFDYSGLAGAVTDYISGTDSKFRIYHTSPGNAAHNLYVDYVAIQIQQVVIAAAGVYQTFTDFTAGVSNNLTLDAPNGTMTITKAGIYLVNMTVSFSGTDSASFESHIFVDDVKVDKIGLKRRLGSSGDVGSSSFTGVLDLALNEVLKIKITSEVAGVYAAVENINWNVTRVN